MSDTDLPGSRPAPGRSADGARGQLDKRAITGQYTPTAHHRRMPNRTRAIDEALHRLARQRLEFGEQLRTARRLHGLTQRNVGAAIGISDAEVARRELARRGNPGIESLAAQAAAVGLRLSIRLYPVGGETRDAAQLRNLARFLARSSASFRRQLEAVMPVPGDLRALDAVLSKPGVCIAVEAVTRLADVQAQVREAQLKARDFGATRLLIVVAATRANRRALDSARPVLAAAFDLDTRRVMAALEAGEEPDRDAIVLI